MQDSVIKHHCQLSRIECEIQANHPLHKLSSHTFNFSLKLHSILLFASLGFEPRRALKSDHAVRRQQSALSSAQGHSVAATAW